jgi:hypothetical protein
MPDYTAILTKVEGGVATIWLNRSNRQADRLMSLAPVQGTGARAMLAMSSTAAAWRVPMCSAVTPHSAQG